jgi:uncharacterized phage protein (TIGR02220 family)
MGKNPAFQFYPSDWTRDLDDLDIQIEGAWIRVLCRLWWASPKGQATKTLKEWSRILRKTERKTNEILKILIEKGIADGSVLDNQNVTIISRRMVRDYQISQIRRDAGRKGGNPALKKPETFLDNQNDNQNPTPSSSSSKENILSSVQEVIDYLNAKSGKKFNPKTKSTMGHINARLSEGFTVDDFKHVINVKCKQWLKDPSMNKFIRPDTLFAGKFEAYRNEQPITKAPSW